METKSTQEDVTRWRYLKGDNPQESRDNQLSSGKMSSNDEALFNAGLNYADPGSAAKDYNKSITTFHKLVAEHPRSAWAYRGHVISEILQENAKLRKQATDLQQENAKLKEIIEQSKKVDIEIGQKKRE